MRSLRPAHRGGAGRSVRLIGAAAVAAVATSFAGGAPAGASVIPSLPGAPTSSLCPVPTIATVATATGQQAAAPGTTVAVTGSNFGGQCATALTLGGHGVSITVDSPTRLHFAMPAGNPGGAVVVTLTDFVGDANSSTGTHDFVALPTVSALAPADPLEGQSVSASGTGFSLAGLSGATAGVSYCGAPPQPAQIVSDTRLELPGPGSYCNGSAALFFSTPQISVGVPAGPVAVSAQITSVSPAGPVAPGSSLTVTGRGFGPAGSATVSGVSAAVQSWSDTSVVLVVPAGVGSGQVVLTRGDGTSAGSTALQVASASSGAPDQASGPQPVGAGSAPGQAVSAAPTGPGAVAAQLGGSAFNASALKASTGSAAAPTLGAFAASSSAVDQNGAGPITVAPGTPEAVAEAEGATGYTQGYSDGAQAVPSTPAIVNDVSGVLSLVAPHTLPVPWMVASILLLALAAAAYLVVIRQGGTGALILPPVNAPNSFWRAAGIAGAVALVLSYIITAVSVLMTLFTYWLPGSGSATLPGASLYEGTAILLSVVLTAIAGRYVYYYYCWIRSRHDFAHARPVDVEALKAKVIPYMKFQVTTRGGALETVERTVAHVIDVAVAHPWLAPMMSVEVITESVDEAGHLPVHFHDAPIEVSAVCLPKSYRTPNGTGLKARALHYLVERRLEGWNRKPGRTFVVHLDEETLVTVDHTLVLVDYLAGDPRPVSQGPILYPMEWEKAPWLCRAMESLRPFGCSECARVMSNPPPPHLHGSNLVIDEDVENRIGWDFGTVDGEPYIAEDLLFGLRAFALLGREGFGWHGATMLEQPPLSVYWAVQQRLRWVLGALQGWRAMGTREDLLSIPVKDRARLRRAVGYRIATYALGFPVGFAGLFFLVHHPAGFLGGVELFLHHPLQEVTSIGFTGVWRLAITIAGLGWIFSYQIGLARNLRYQNLSLFERAKQHAVIFLMTFVTGMFETAGPFLALTRWMMGHRQAKWTPTPKTAHGPAATPVAVPAGVPVAVPAGAPVAVPAFAGGAPAPA